MGTASTGLLRDREERNGEPDAANAESSHGRELCRGDKVSVFCERQEPSHWPEQRHRQARLLLTFDGAGGEVTWRRRSGSTVTETLRSDQFCLVTAECAFSILWKAAGDVVCLHLGERFVEEHLAVPLHGIIVEDFRPLVRLDGCLWALAETLWESCRRRMAPSASFIEGIGTALASRLLEWQFRPTSDPTAPPVLPPNLLQRVLAHIEAHLEDRPSVDDLAKQAGLCVDHFARLFRNATGLTPSQFIQKCRVQKALELLRSGELRVAEAACQLGFCDQSHFHRQCRKFFGLTPRAILKAALLPKTSQENSESSKICAA